MKIDDLLSVRKSNYNLALELQDELLSSYYGDQLHINIHKTDISDVDVSKTAYTLTIKSEKYSTRVDIDYNHIILYNDISLSTSNASYISVRKYYIRELSNVLEEILYLFVYDASIIVNSGFNLLKLGLDYYYRNKLYLTKQIKFNEIQNNDYVMLLYKGIIYSGISTVLDSKVIIDGSSFDHNTKAVYILLKEII